MAAYTVLILNHRQSSFFSYNDTAGSNTSNSVSSLLFISYCLVDVGKHPSLVFHPVGRAQGGVGDPSPSNVQRGASGKPLDRTGNLGAQGGLCGIPLYPSSAEDPHCKCLPIALIVLVLERSTSHRRWLRRRAVHA